MQSDHVKTLHDSGSKSKPLNDAIKQRPRVNSSSTHMSSGAAGDDCISSGDIDLSRAPAMFNTKETSGSDLKSNLISSSETDATRAVLISNSSSVSTSVSTPIPLNQGEEKTTYTGEGPAFHRRRSERASSRSFTMFKLTAYCWGQAEAMRLAAKFQWPTEPPTL